MQRGFFGLFIVEVVLARGLDVGVDVDVVVDGVATPTAVLKSDVGASACVGDEARRAEGGSSWRVAESCNLRSATVLEGARGWPPMIRRTSVGSVVEADKNSRTLETV